MCAEEGASPQKRWTTKEKKTMAKLGKEEKVGVQNTGRKERDRET